MNCSFCPKTKRARTFMSPESFRIAAQKLRPLTQYIYLHISGEPLLHPELEKILDICTALDFRVSITTNGTLLKKQTDILLNSPSLYKVSISLHSFEANTVSFSLEEYVNTACEFAQNCSDKNIICSLRLWNTNGLDSLNSDILAILKKYFPDEWKKNRRGFTLTDKVYLERAEKFDWPDIDGKERDVRFCMGGRDQLGVLSDGTVVPCCLDSEGNIPLGNIFTQDINDILSSERYKSFFDGFSQGKPSEKLCKRCGYAEAMFTK